MKPILYAGLGTSFLCLIGSIVALIAGVGRVEIPPPLRFEPDPFVLPAMVQWPGQRDFNVTVVNDSSKPALIAGCEEYCGAACFSGVGLPVQIPAWGRGHVLIRVRSNRPGSLSEKLVFFTDQNSQPRLALKIEGNIPKTMVQKETSHAKKQ